MSWRDYWNGDTSIYANARHRAVHDTRVAADVVRLLPPAARRVLDHGCGDTTAALDVARGRERLLLCDGAATVRVRLGTRYGADGRIDILSPEEVETRLGDGSLDAVVANSLLQYMPRDEVPGLLELWHRKLAPGGRLVIGDVISPDVSAAKDALALLGFGWRGGFLAAATLGLVRTALSPYRKLRQELGLSMWTEAEFLALLDGAGYVAARHRPNIGHNQARMTFVATRRA